MTYRELSELYNTLTTRLSRIEVLADHLYNLVLVDGDDRQIRGAAIFLCDEVKDAEAEQSRMNR